VSAAVGPPTALDGLDAAGLQGELATATEVRDLARAALADADQWRFNARRAGDLETAERVKVVVHERQSAVAAADARVRAVQAALAALAANQPHPGSVAAADPESVPERFENVEQFVAEFLAPVIGRRLGGGSVWCPKWWDHPEAADRLWALWRGFEAARLQAGGSKSAWWVYHVDAHLRVLLSENGPFWECRKGRHNVGPGLPHEPAPEGHWDVFTAELDSPVTAVNPVPLEAPADELSPDEERSGR